MKLEIREVSPMLPAHTGLMAFIRLTPAEGKPFCFEHENDRWLWAMSSSLRRKESYTPIYMIYNGHLTIFA